MKRSIELSRPDLRGYYRMPVKGRVVSSYASDGRYWADVQPTRNDESDDAGQPVIPKVEIPVLWGGPSRGVVCPIPNGTLVAVGFYDGDPAYPFIQHIRWHGNGAPNCEMDAFIIQHSPGCHIKIDSGKNLIEVTPADKNITAGGNITIVAAGVVRITGTTILLN